MSVPPRQLPLLQGAEHLRFRCTACGECCHHYRVALTHHDLRRLSEGLGQPAGELVEWLDPEAVDMTDEPGSFVRLAGGRRLMVLAYRGGACQFLQADQRCGVYGLRPLDCRLFPFDLVRDEQGELVGVARLDREGCGEVQEAGAHVAELAQQDAQRWRELADYQERLLRWNRLAQHRQRFRQPLGDAEAFLKFLGFAAS